MSDRILSVVDDPNAVREVWAVVQFRGARSLIEAIEWLLSSPQVIASGAKVDLRLQVVSETGYASLVLFSRPAVGEFDSPFAHNEVLAIVVQHERM